ncbi:MAG: hypothetical protein LBJ47_11560 [Tannerella sp.]|nr:hypothetical protein [Tannerella sp.]
MNYERILRWGCLGSLDSSSLRGGTTKQSGDCQVFPDCFTSFAMTVQSFRDIPVPCSIMARAASPRQRLINMGAHKGRPYQY